MIGYNTLVVLIGVSILGACAGMVGTFAVLRRRALTGDALAHASLPGICLAFLMAGERNFLILLLGAFLSGLVGILVITFLRSYTRVKEDAAIGIVLSVFFGAGIVLWSIIQSTATTGSKAGLDTYILGKTAGMIDEDAYAIAIIAGCCLVVILLCYKEFKLIAFDTGFARVQGWPTLPLDLLLMGLLAVTVTIGLPSVGAILISALLIIPGATARFWTHRLGLMLFLAAMVGFVSGVIGTFLSSTYDNVPTGAIIVVVAAAFFLTSMILAPRRGIVANFLAQRRFQSEMEERNLLRILYDLTEPQLPQRVVLRTEDIKRRRSWRRGRLARLLQSLVRKEYLESPRHDCYILSETGLARAGEVARGYRLWECFLTEYAEQATSVANLADESVEGVLPGELVAQLSAKLKQQGRLPPQVSVAEEVA